MAGALKGMRVGRCRRRAGVGVEDWGPEPDASEGGSAINVQRHALGTLHFELFTYRACRTTPTSTCRTMPNPQELNAATAQAQARSPEAGAAANRLVAAVMEVGGWPGCIVRRWFKMLITFRRSTVWDERFQRVS